MTGHDDRGHAVILVDDIAPNAFSSPTIPGFGASVPWLTAPPDRPHHRRGPGRRRIAALRPFPRRRDGIPHRGVPAGLRLPRGARRTRSSTRSTARPRPRTAPSTPAASTSGSTAPTRSTTPSCWKARSPFSSTRARRRSRRATSPSSARRATRGRTAPTAWPESRSSSSERSPSRPTRSREQRRDLSARAGVAMIIDPDAAEGEVIWSLDSDLEPAPTSRGSRSSSVVTACTPRRATTDSGSGRSMSRSSSGRLWAEFAGVSSAARQGRSAPPNPCRTRGGSPDAPSTTRGTFWRDTTGSRSSPSPRTVRRDGGHLRRTSRTGRRLRRVSPVGRRRGRRPGGRPSFRT